MFNILAEISFFNITIFNFAVRIMGDSSQSNITVKRGYSIMNSILKYLN